jgi:hypothetical protein
MVASTRFLGDLLRRLSRPDLCGSCCPFIATIGCAARSRHAQLAVPICLYGCEVAKLTDERIFGRSWIQRVMPLPSGAKLKHTHAWVVGQPPFQPCAPGEVVRLRPFIRFEARGTCRGTTPSGCDGHRHTRRDVCGQPANAPIVETHAAVGDRGPEHAAEVCHSVDGDLTCTAVELLQHVGAGT